MKIILQRQSYGWAVWFYGVPGMPEDVEIPLPFTRDASLAMVAADMRRRFPGASIRNTDNI